MDTTAEKSEQKVHSARDHTMHVRAKGPPGGSRQCVTVLAEADDSPDVCWVCLDQGTPDKPLLHPCNCPSWCHASCIARWQLQSAGTRREHYCDFCTARLPDWKGVLTPCGGSVTPAIMNVNFDNKTYSFEVSPGMDGYALFTRAIRRAFHLPDDSELNITFTCDEPSSGALLTLQGAGAYDAAVHCASVSAARRMHSTPHSECEDSEGCEDATDTPHSGFSSDEGSGGSSSPAAAVAEGGAAAHGGAAPSRSGGSARRGSSSGGSSEAGGSGALPPRRSGSSFGRKLRSALNDFLALR